MSATMDRPSGYQSGRAMIGYDGAPAAGPPLSSLSQPDPSPEFATAPYQSRTLPRPPRRGGVAPHPATGSRRRLVSSRVSDYLKSLNSMTRSIVLEKEYVEERHAGEWQSMDETLQEEVVDDYFMPIDVHAHYGTLPRSRRSYREPRSPSAASSSHEDRLSFRNARVLQSALSQPPDTTAYTASSSLPETYFIPPTHNRLHKNQLSYRSKALRKVMNLPPPTDSVHHQQRQQQQPLHQSQNRDSGLGSDGESPRTSDEDQNPLGFQRNHLRSFSLRQKRGGGGRNHGSLSRSSTRRAPQRADNTRGGTLSSHSPAAGPRCQGRENKGYDAEVDLPDDSLLNDHMTSSAQNQTGSRSPPKPSRYSSRARRSGRMQPRVLADKFTTEDEEEDKEQVVVIQNSISRVASNSSTSTVASTFNDFDPSVPIYCNRPAVVLTNLRRVHSEDSIDTDTESIAQSNISNLSKSTGILTEDELLSDAATPIPICLTPESLLSGPSPLASSGSRRQLVRSRPQSRRAGSFLQTSTSDFAKRRAQFKPNMLRNQQSTQNSPTHTRESTPAFSRQNTPGVSSPTPHPDPSPSPHLKTPPPSSLSLKHRRSSTSESIDTPITPEYLSSPPHTPLVKSISAGGGSISHHHLHIHRDSREQQKRESGYISSSSESFPFTARK